ncbi:hypothetical protein ACFE33_07260 [Falsihalocynthiibacter sp. SS001]|uniref:hypothetical protein n=1 Tax=Falsihalocynthiibacter sp. SS001 TaxID=3349698 RepID=UPI0036D2BE3E
MLVEYYVRFIFMIAPAIVTFFAARRVMYSRSDHWSVYMINAAWGVYVTFAIGKDILTATAPPLEAFAVATTPVIFWSITVAICNRRNTFTRRYAARKSRGEFEDVLLPEERFLT